MASTAPSRPSKSICTTCSMGMPKLASMVWTSWSGPLLYVELIRLYLPVSLVLPTTDTMVSLGMESTLTWPVAGMMWTILTTSLRWPAVAATDPKWATLAALSPTRESDPIRSTLKGAPTGAFLRCRTVTFVTWWKRYCT